jgi:hypothetical protein
LLVVAAVKEVGREASVEPVVVPHGPQEFHLVKVEEPDKAALDQGDLAAKVVVAQVIRAEAMAAQVVVKSEAMAAPMEELVPVVAVVAATEVAVVVVEIPTHPVQMEAAVVAVRPITTPLTSLLPPLLLQVETQVVDQ